MNRRHIFLPSLIHTKDAEELRTFLADVKNVQKLRIRALRLGGWRLLNPLERGILSLTVRTLTRVKSNALLETLVKIFVKILPYLLSRFERRLLKNMEMVQELLSRLGEKARDLYLLRLSKNNEYIISEAIKLTVSEETGAGVIYSL